MATKQKLKTATKQEVAEALKTVNRKEIPVLPVDPETFIEGNKPAIPCFLDSFPAL